MSQSDREIELLAAIDKIITITEQTQERPFTALSKIQQIAMDVRLPRPAG
jgi:hypothetical protein